MYKITLKDGVISDGITEKNISYYTDNVGKLDAVPVTVEEDKRAKIYFEKNLSFENKKVCIIDNYDHNDMKELMVRKLHIFARYIQFQGHYQMIMSFCAKGIVVVNNCCGIQRYIRCERYESPVLNYNFQKKLPDTSDDIQTYQNDSVEFLVYYPILNFLMYEDMKKYFETVGVTDYDITNLFRSIFEEKIM